MFLIAGCFPYPTGWTEGCGSRCFLQGTIVPSLRIRSIFGRIRIQQIRMLKTGIRILLAFTKNQFNHLKFLISIRILQIFLCGFFLPAKMEKFNWNLKALFFNSCLYNFTKVAKVGSASGIVRYLPAVYYMRRILLSFVVWIRMPTAI